MDRDAWKRKLTPESAWPWPCPACRTGRLHLDKTSLISRETKDSRDYRIAEEEGYWEPDIVTERFCCMLVCNQQSCREIVMVCGTTSDEQEDDGEGGTEWKRYLSPVYFHPPPPIIMIPRVCPEDV